MDQPPDDRPRTPPRERFRPSEDVIDLPAATAKLLEEPPSNRHGHRQITLYKHGAETLALFHFDAGGGLSSHVVDGPVVIHVLDGSLTVATDHAEHELQAGQLLRLGAGVRHDVAAHESSRMLLTVFLEPARPPVGGVLT